MRCSNTFEFVVGFAGEGVVVETVEGPLVNFLQKAVLEQAEVWDSAVTTLALYDTLMHSSIAVVWAHNDSSGVRQVSARVLVASCHKARMWGLNLAPYCWHEACLQLHPIPGNVRVLYRDADCRFDGDALLDQRVGCAGVDTQGEAKFHCLTCDAQTGWMQRPAFVHPFPFSKSVYWLDFPRQFEDRLPALQRASEEAARLALAAPANPVVSKSSGAAKRRKRRTARASAGGSDSHLTDMGSRPPHKRGRVQGSQVVVS